MNKRQYKKYCKEFLGFMMICGFVAKKHKYFAKFTRKSYKMSKNIRKERSKRRIDCKLPNCEGCVYKHLPF